MRILSELVYIPRTWKIKGYCMTFLGQFIIIIVQPAGEHQSVLYGCLELENVV